MKRIFIVFCCLLFTVIKTNVVAAEKTSHWVDVLSPVSTQEKSQLAAKRWLTLNAEHLLAQL
ncbi:MAG: hypothetical protein KAG20_08990, partial [Cocleimonas sp.]|nr:hypothetical protein [Cocleimonas sp.]